MFSGLFTSVMLFRSTPLSCIHSSAMPSETSPPNGSPWYFPSLLLTFAAAPRKGTHVPSWILEVINSQSSRSRKSWYMVSCIRRSVENKSLNQDLCRPGDCSEELIHEFSFHEAFYLAGCQRVEGL